MPHNFTGLTTKDNNFRKGVFLDSFDEPTYLTFALDFNFDDSPVITDVDEANLWNSPLFSKGGSPSASSFLLGRGYTAQADGLATFKGILRHLTYNAPWYFQEIEGLNDLFKSNTDMSKGYKTMGNVLKIKTLEAVDLRIAEIAGLYRNAIYDMKHRRERVPDNLRWFSVDVYVAEFRNLRYRIPGEGQTLASTLGVDTAAIGAIVGGGNAISNVMDQYGFIKFRCRQCEFDFSKSLPVGQTVKVHGEGRNQEINNFEIKVGWVEEESKYGDGTRLYEDSTATSIKNPWGLRKVSNDVQNGLTFLSNLPVIGESIKTAGQKVTDGLSKVGGMINPALKSAVQFLNPPVELGDAYSKGYESNGYIVPKKYNTFELGDVYSKGYESNGDIVPKKPPSPDQNVYI